MRSRENIDNPGITSISEAEPVELQKFPHPYQAAFTVASDIDSGSILRFRAVHALFCSNEVIKEKSPEWNVLGLLSSCSRFDREHGGVRGLGLDFADSFFLVGDPTTFGMYRYLPKEDRFSEDVQQGENCAELVRQWLKQGCIDSFHTFLHHTRRQVEPLLQDFYQWCERESVAKPIVWINHSAAVTPSGICPDKFQPGRAYRLARLTARSAVGPLFGRKRLPLRHAFVRYWGDTPGSPYYVNDLLYANGLRYVWLNMSDSHRDKIMLPEREHNGRTTILQPVTMDDGVRYWQFERCYGGPPGRTRGEVYLRDSQDGYDSSHLISESNLEALCRANGTCIFFTHWTHYRSMPISNETIDRFDLLRQWQQAGKIWVTSTARLLKWTRLRTFLKLACRREGKRLIVEIEGLDDPIFGKESLSLGDLNGLCLRLRQPQDSLTVAIHGQPLSSEQLCRIGNLCWVNGGAPRLEAASGVGARP